MKLIHWALPLLAALGCVPGQAQVVNEISDNSLFGDLLDGTSLFASASVTLGARSTVYGDILAGDLTAGAHSTIGGNIFSVGASTIGAGNSKVSGNLTSGALTTVGATATIGGNLVSAGAVTLGATSWVQRNLLSDGAITIGAGSGVGGSIAGDAVTVGANAIVNGNVSSVGPIVVPVGVKLSNVSTLSAVPVLSGVVLNLDAQSLEVSTAQSALTKMGPGTVLATTMAVNTTLDAGVYSASALTTTAGTVLTLDGRNLANQSWVFNIASYLVTGASSAITLINAGAGDSIIWNTGAGTTLGADSTFAGTILANADVTIGAGTSITGAGGSCGGAFSASAGVTTGAGASIGTSGCTGLESEFTIVDGVAVYPSSTSTVVTPVVASAVPEPSSYLMMLAGLALVAAFCRVRTRRAAGRPVIFGHDASFLASRMSI